MSKLHRMIAFVSFAATSAHGEIVSLAPPAPANVALETGGRFVTTATLPPSPAEWRDAKVMLLLEVEVKGAVGGTSATGSIALRTKGGATLGGADASTAHRIAAEARECWKIEASSENLGPSEPAPITFAFDGDPKTFWHTQWEGGQSTTHPHKVEIEFAAPVTVNGVRYLPRQHGSANGTIAKYKVEVLDADGRKHAFAGTWPAKDTRVAREVAFENGTLRARRLTLIAEAEIHGQPFSSAAEIEPVLEQPAPAPETSPLQRVYVRVPVSKLGDAKEVVVELRGSTATPIVFGNVRLYRLPELATRAMLGKSNGVDGPDRVDLGPLGIDTYTVHDHAPLPVMAVCENSPSARVGLVAGDVIVGVDGAALPVSSCAVGDRWFEVGHEPVFGRAIERAQARGQDAKLALDVIRASGERDTLNVALTAPRLPDDFPFDAAATAALERDLIDYVVRTQKENGSWSTDGNDFIQTTFSALALLGTRDPAHAERVLRAVRWTLRRFREPDAFGNLGYWSSGYATILAAEWHLATGDRSVLPFLENTFEWAATGTHTSAWKMPTLGHGPDGLPYEQKALVAPAVHLLAGEALAKRCGVNGRLFDVLLPFMEEAWSDPADGGHGALGYNGSYKDLEEFWSRSGLFALAATLRNERLDMAAAMAAAMEKHHTVMRGSHAYGAPGNALGLIGLSVADPERFARVMRTWRFSFTAAWEPGFGLRYSTPHMGSPYMGEEGLINPAFAVVLSARRKGLHITGATDRDWLPIASVSSPPPGALAIERGRDGRVRVIAPGCSDVRVAFGGEMPNAESPKYLGPFPVREFGIVTAAAFRDGQRVEESVSRRVFGRSKAAWSIVEASGYPAVEEARRRADALCDEDDARTWIADRGQDAAAYPHHVVIDLGEAQTLYGIALRLGDTAPREVAVRVGDEVAMLEEVATAESPREGVARIAFAKAVTGRFVRVDFRSGHSDRLAIRELELIEPVADMRRDEKGRVVLGAGIDGFDIRYTTDGSIPTADSALYRAPFTFERGFILTRCFGRAGAGPATGAWLDAAK
jgi:Family of unknown function (DUF6288)/F5/8 type C domain/Chitobiase/beta-hexosaminidase C-terminal domain